jgi:hypothetical protein
MTTVSSILENFRDQAAGRIVVISSEDICLFSGVAPIVKLERIKNIFVTLGPIRIILAVRDQVSLIKSIYLTEHRGEMLNIPGTQQTWFPNFDQYIDIHFRYACGSVLESFRFAANLERYRKWAGIDNVYTYSFDDFKKNQEGSLRKICQFIGIDDNDACLHLTARTRENSHHSSRAYLATTLRKRLFGDFSIGQFFPMPIRLLLRRWITSGPAHSVNISSRSLNRLRDYYSADNQLLKERYDISLNI